MMNPFTHVVCVSGVSVQGNRACFLFSIILWASLPKAYSTQLVISAERNILLPVWKVSKTSYLGCHLPASMRGIIMAAVW